LRKTGYGYNAYHQPTSITNAPGEVTALTYDAQRRLQTVQTPAGLLSTHTYGTDGRLQRTVDSAVGGGPLRTNAFTWLGGYLRTRTDERDLALTYTYDKLGRLTRIDYPDSTYEFHGYTNGAGIKLLDRTYSRDRLGQITRTEYTPLRQVHKVFNPRGHATTYTYCGCGGPTTVANALGQVTTYTYNNAGRHTDTLYPDNTVVSYGYDLAGRLRTVSDSLGTATNFYDNLNRLTTVSNAFGRVLGLGYDLEDNVTARTNANGVILLSTYDQLHRPLSQTWPDTGIERFLYTPRGLVAHTNQLGKVTRIEYDPLGRKTAETNANLEVIRYTYKPAGDLLTLRDGKNQVTTWAYDPYGQVTNKLDQASAQILRYQYDAGGRLTNRWSAAKGNTAYVLRTFF